MATLEELQAQVEQAKAKFEQIDDQVDKPEPEIPEVPEVLEEQAESIDSSEQEETVETIELTEVEQQAMEMGWKPQSEFDGEEDEFKSAEEYIALAPVYKEMAKLKKEIKRRDKVNEDLLEKYKTAEQRGREQALKEIKEQKREAVENKDLHTLEKLEEEEFRLKTEETKGPEDTKAGLPEPIQKFVENNKWASPENLETAEDVKKYNLAMKLEQEYVQAIGKSTPEMNDKQVEQLIAYIEGGINETFKLEPKAPPKPKTPHVAGASKAVKSKVHSGEHPDWDKLTSVEKTTALKYCKGDNPIMTMDEYISNILKDKK